MNLLGELAKPQTTRGRDKIIRWVGRDKQRFARLIDVFIAGPYRITQHAAWPLTYCVEAHPELVSPHLKRLLTHMDDPDLHGAVRRNIVRLLQFVEIPARFQGKVADRCFAYMNDRSEAIAVRVFAMTVLFNLSKVQPGLKSELAVAIEDNLAGATAAYSNRGRKFLSHLIKGFDPKMHTH